MAKLAGLPYPEVRAALARLSEVDALRRSVSPSCSCATELIEPPRCSSSRCRPTCPQSVGVSSSAALEVATARALGADAIDPLRLAALCQEAENHVVGAPCGIMDQVTVAMGTPGAILPILCRPASVRPPLVPCRPTSRWSGWPTGAEHDVGGAPYRRARAAAFMGKRMVEDCARPNRGPGSASCPGPRSTTSPTRSTAPIVPRPVGAAPTTT